MELTRFEKRVLSPGYRRRCRWLYLAPGLAFIALGLFVAVYGNGQSRKIEATWKRNMDRVAAFVPSTDREREIHDAAMHATDAAGIGWTRVMDEASKGTAKVFFITGGFLVGLYFNEVRHKRLLEKMGAPGQPL